MYSWSGDLVTDYLWSSKLRRVDKVPVHSPIQNSTGESAHAAYGNIQAQPRASDCCSSCFPCEYHNAQANGCPERNIYHPLCCNLFHHLKVTCWTRLGAAEVTHLVTPVLPKLHPSHDLLVDEVGGHVVLTRVVPGSEDLLPEEEPPRRVALLRSLLLGVLLALGHSIHHVVIATPQRGHLGRAEGNVAFT